MRSGWRPSCATWTGSSRSPRRMPRSCPPTCRPSSRSARRLVRPATGRPRTGSATSWRHAVSPSRTPVTVSAGGARRRSSMPGGKPRPDRPDERRRHPPGGAGPRPPDDRPRGDRPRDALHGEERPYGARPTGGRPHRGPGRLPADHERRPPWERPTRPPEGGRPGQAPWRRPGSGTGFGAGPAPRPPQRHEPAAGQGPGGRGPRPDRGHGGPPAADQRPDRPPARPAYRPPYGPPFRPGYRPEAGAVAPEPEVPLEGLLGPDEELVAGRRPVEEAFAARRTAHRLLVVPNRRAALERGERPLILVLDSLEDPHNVGSLLRTAEAAGVHGVMFPTRHAAPLTPSAVKASAGAVCREALRGRRGAPAYGARGRPAGRPGRSARARSQARRRRRRRDADLPGGRPARTAGARRRQRGTRTVGARAPTPRPGRADPDARPNRLAQRCCSRFRHAPGGRRPARAGAAGRHRRGRARGSPGRAADGGSGRRRRRAGEAEAPRASQEDR